MITTIIDEATGQVLGWLDMARAPVPRREHGRVFRMPLLADSELPSSIADVAGPSDVVDAVEMRSPVRHQRRGKHVVGAVPEMLQRNRYPIGGPIVGRFVGSPNHLAT